MSQVEQKKKKNKNQAEQKRKKKSSIFGIDVQSPNSKRERRTQSHNKENNKKKIVSKGVAEDFFEVAKGRQYITVTAISLKVKVCKKRNTLLLTAPRRSNFPRAFSKDRRPSTFISSLNIYYTNKGACFDKFIRACMLALFVHKHYEKRKATALMCTFQT